MSDVENVIEQYCKSNQQSNTKQVIQTTCSAKFSFVRNWYRFLLHRQCKTLVDSRL